MLGLLLSLLSVGAGLAGCMGMYADANKVTEDFDFVVVKVYDLAIASPETRVFYAYEYGKRDGDRAMTPDWMFSNLVYGGAAPIEAWHDAGSSTTNFGNGAEGMTVVPPVFVVGLAGEDADMARLHYRKLEGFDPYAEPNGPGSNLSHYVLHRREGKDGQAK